MTIIIINNNMNTPSVFILDLLNAVSMQISIWQWDMHMISKYGFYWRYKEPWDEKACKSSSIINPIRGI
jgi:hypothetical protein